jgi:hypothetical protein
MTASDITNISDSKLSEYHAPKKTPLPKKRGFFSSQTTPQRRF